MRILETMNRSAWLMSLLAFLPCAAAWAAEERVPKTIKGISAPAAPVIDGVLDEASWMRRAGAANRHSRIS